MKRLAKACNVVAAAAGVFLAGTAPLCASQDPSTGVVLAFAWMAAFKSQMLGALMIVAAVLLSLGGWYVYIRQQREHSLRTRQLEDVVSARTQELELANADLKRLSITDPLTGVKNRRFVEFSITEDLARIRRSAQGTANEWGDVPEDSANISFLMIDIDFFKRINDRFGHAAGDQVLRQMAALFTSMVRESDTTVRWGGEEFLIIARNPRANDTAILAERLRRRVASYPFAISEQQAIRVTCSIGFASWPFFAGEPDALEWEKVVALADCGLYKAKNNGRNAWCGIVAQPGGKDKVVPGVMDDPDAAEKKGIVSFHASYSSIVGDGASAPTVEPQVIPPLAELPQDAANPVL